MQYRNIPGTDLKVSAICMGGVQFCVEDGVHHTFNLLDKFHELGGNFVDTANIYGKWLASEKNVSELYIGEWMKERGNREKIIVGTKGGHPHLSSMNISRLSKREVARDLDESLKSLQTDYIDFYWLHRDDEKLPVEEILDYLNAFVKEGKIRYFGCSNWKVCRISEAVQYALKHGIMSFTGNQMMWSLAVPNENSITDKTLAIMDGEGQKFHEDTKMAAIPYSSQANGFFEKLDRQGDNHLSDNLKALYYNEENLNRYKRVKKLAGELSRSVTEVALAYLLSQPFTTIPIVGCRTVEQLEVSLKAGDLILDKGIVDYLASGK